MKFNRIQRIVFSLVVLLTSLLPVARAAVDSAATLVYLRQSCTDNNTQLNDCFTTMSDLLSWVYGTRQPSASSPLIIDVGPGSFPDFNCTNAGNITVRGSGVGNTQLTYATAYHNAAVSIQNCSNLAFQDLTITGGTGGLGLWWNEGGNATFTNVAITGPNTASYDYCTVGTKAIIKWYSSSLQVTGATNSSAVVASGCAQHWFYGSEIINTVTGGSADAYAIKVYPFGGNGDVRLYGSSVRMVTTAGANVTGTLYTIYNPGGTFHMHGGEIVVDASSGAGDTNVVAVSTSAGFVSHMLDTSFGVKPAGSGTATRLFGPAASPFLWAQGVTRPAISSNNGADLFVQTNCDGTGCTTAGTQPHLLVYTKQCTTTAGPWFDVGLNKCVGQ